MAEEKVPFSFDDVDDESASSGFEPIPEGDYEFEVEAEVKKKKDNTGDYLSIKYKVRKDVEGQKFGGRCVFESLGRDKGNPQWFDLIKLKKILKTRNDYRKNFSDVEECIQYINGYHLIATVENTYDDVKGETKNVIKMYSQRPSVWDMQDHSAPSTDAVPNHPGNDSDVPW